MLRCSIVKMALLGTIVVLPQALYASASAEPADTTFRTPTQGIFLRRLLDVPVADSMLAMDAGRPRAVHYSDAYYTRLAIHRVGSYAILPLFAGEYFLGQRLMTETNVQRWIKPMHRLDAGAIATLFAVNTVTGVWNFVESRKEPEGRARKFVHMALMLAADAGFTYTGMIANGARRFQTDATRHRNAAIASMGLATAGTLVMWLWKD
jgi:hypothetical protein